MASYPNTGDSYDTGTIGGILGMKYWEDHFSTGYRNPDTGALSVTASQESEIVSILSAGTFFGGRQAEACIPGPES